jgi:hypothetical protein
VSQFLSDIGLLPQQSQIGLKLTEWVDNLLPTPGIPDVPDLLTEPAQCAAYLNGVRFTTLMSSKQKPLIRLGDSNIEILQELDGELDVSLEELMDDTGKCTVKVTYNNWLTDYMTNQTHLIADLHLLIDPIPTQQDWRKRWGGKITEIHIKKDDKGIHSIELTALSFFEHAKRLLVAANPIFPPEIQLPRMWVLPGPCRTICALTSFINLGRLFMPGWSFITNVFNPAGWINPLSPDAVLNVLPTAWPIQVAFVDPVLDQSRWTAIGANWTDWYKTYKDVLTDSGCQMRCYTYLTTDPDSPNVELANLLNLAPELLGMLLGIDLSTLEQGVEKLVAPLRNCCVFSFEQVDGITGPTGTAVDGLLSAVAVTLDDLITPVTVNLSTGETFDPGGVLNGEPIQDAAGVGATQLLQQLWDVAPAPPKVIWWDGTYHGLLTTDLTWHKGSVKTIMTGSKSPVIVNEAITFAIKYGLSQLSDVINEYVGIWETQNGIPGDLQTPGTPGLDELYQGQLDNTLLAWQRFTDPIRALMAGDVAWQEHFEQGSGTAYTLASVLTLRDGDWKTRAFAAFKADTIDGHPWMANIDYYLGDRVGFEDNGIIYVDNVYGIKREWSWDKPLTVSIKIGEDKQKNDPFGAAFKTMAAVYGLISEFAGEGTLFQG